MFASIEMGNGMTEKSSESECKFNFCFRSDMICIWWDKARVLVTFEFGQRNLIMALFRKSWTCLSPS